MAEEAIELSPFVVTSDSDKGYVATSSLAGSRVNTQLKDIASQIDVMTPEFLNDISAVSIEDAVAFSTNNAPSAEQSTGANDGTATTRSNGRARGFDAVTSSSDFYPTNLPSDFYNIDRLTIANGPQSILFGMGNAGGVVDVTTKRAQMRDRDQIEMRVDDSGSVRGMLDINKQLIGRKLALRIVGLKNNGRSYVEGSYNNQQRVFGAATWKIGPKTTLRLSAERMNQHASLATNYVSLDFVSPWVAAGSPLFDNSKGNASITDSATPYLAKNANALRVISYDGSESISSVYVWNGSALTRGPHQLPKAADTTAGSLTDNSIYPVDHDPRVGGRVNVLKGSMLRGSLEHQFSKNLFAELGFNYERVRENRGGPFFNAESINILADTNKYLPGGTAAAPVTTVNPHAGDLYIESYPAGQELWDETKELRLTTAYEFKFSDHFSNFARFLGRHKIVAMASHREDRNLSQDSRATIVGDNSFTTGDLLNNSRLVRVRYYLDPSSGNYYAGGLPGQNNGQIGDWTLTDSRTGETIQTSMFNNPAGRTSAPSGTFKDIYTYMAALQSYFLDDRINVFAGRRVDDVKTYFLNSDSLVRGDRLTAGDKQGLYMPLSETSFSSDASSDVSGKTYAYGVVAHATHWLSFFASKSSNTGLPQAYLDPDNNVIPGIYSDGYDYGFRVSAKDDAISLRVNFYMENQHNLIGDGQTVRTTAAVVEQRLRGTDKPAGIAEVSADGYDPVTRGDVYRSVENKKARGIDATLSARITRYWDLRLTVGRQQTKVFNKSAEFNAWVERRLPVWQDFGGLGWDNVTITSTTDLRTVHQYYNEEIATAILASQLRNALPRFRQREWRASLFTNYRFHDNLLKGFNIGGGVRWMDAPMAGFVQIPYPNGVMGDDVTQPIYGGEIFQFDALAGYDRRLRVAGHNVTWRVQLNIRNLFDQDYLEKLRTRNDGGTLQYGRQIPRQVILSSSFEF